MPTVSVRDTASLANRLGICVVPVAEDGTKRPGLQAWREFQERRPTNQELKQWFVDQGPRAGLGFICGKVSGGLELFEFDDAQAVIDFKDLARKAGFYALVLRIELGYAEETPGGGVHWLYRVPTPKPNTKLATKPCEGAPTCTKHEKGQAHVLIETRGEGGFVVTAPSSGPVHPSGKPYILRAGGLEQIALLTDEERDELWTFARILDQLAVTLATPATGSHIDDPDAPGNRFNADTSVSIEGLLEGKGWARAFDRGQESYWRRPGKARGVSATVGFEGLPIVRNFSSSVNLPTDKALDKFGLYTWLEHDGDFTAAGKALYEQGYHGYDPGPMDAEARAKARRQSVEVSAPYHFEHVFPPGHFVTEWIEHCSKRVDAAYEYHEAVALTMLAVATAGLKPPLSVWPDGLKTNLYVLLVGHSSLSRKSTSIRFGRNLLTAARFDWKLPDGGSPEGLVEQIAHRSGKASLWAVSEFGQKLEDLERKASDAGLKKVLLEIYDGDDYEHRRVDKRVKGQGSTAPDVIQVRDPYVSILGGATEDVLQALSTRDVASGLLPRFAYVWPTAKPEYMDVGDVDESWAPEFNKLATRLATLNEWVTNGGSVTFSVGARTVLNKENRALDEEAAHRKILARLGAMCWKLAILATAGEFSSPPSMRLVVDEQQAQWAVAMVRRWRAGALRFGGQVGGETVDEMRFNQHLERVEFWLKEHGGRSDRRSVVRALHLRKRVADEVEQTLNDQGRMGWFEEETPNGGRPSRQWVLQ